MDFLQFFQYLLVIIVPGFIGALLYNVIGCNRAAVNVGAALILDLITFIIMITGLYLFHGVTTIEILIFEFSCLSFTRIYALISILIAALFGVLAGLLKRLLFWVRCA